MNIKVVYINIIQETTNSYEGFKYQRKEVNSSIVNKNRKVEDIRYQTKKMIDNYFIFQYIFYFIHIILIIIAYFFFDKHKEKTKILLEEIKGKGILSIILTAGSFSVVLFCIYYVMLEIYNFFFNKSFLEKILDYSLSYLSLDYIQFYKLFGLVDFVAHNMIFSLFAVHNLPLVLILFIFLLTYEKSNRFIILFGVIVAIVIHLVLKLDLNVMDLSVLEKKQKEDIIPRSKMIDFISYENDSIFNIFDIKNEMISYNPLTDIEVMKENFAKVITVRAITEYFLSYILLFCFLRFFSYCEDNNKMCNIFLFLSSIFISYSVINFLRYGYVIYHSVIDNFYKIIDGKEIEKNPSGKSIDSVESFGIDIKKPFKPYKDVDFYMNELSIMFDVNQKTLKCNNEVFNYDGSIIRFIGQSGCGKTTIFKLLSGNLRTDEKCVFINGCDISAYKYIDVMNVFIAPQQYLNTLTSHNFFTLYDWFHNLTKIGREELIDYLNDMKLEDVIPLLDNSASSIAVSGGQGNRLNLLLYLLRALSDDKIKVLFLDEVRTGLDKSTAHVVMRFIEKISKKDKTVIMIDHHELNSDVNCITIDIGRGGIIQKVIKTNKRD